MWCSKCGTPLDDGVKFCTVCGTMVEDDTFILSNTNETEIVEQGGYGTVPQNGFGMNPQDGFGANQQNGYGMDPQNGFGAPPQVPVYMPDDYSKNKTAKVSSAKTAYIIIIVICLIVILTSAGLIAWTLLKDTDSKGKGNSTDIEEEDEEYEDDEEEEGVTAEPAEGEEAAPAAEEEPDDIVMVDPVPVDGPDAPGYAPAPEEPEGPDEPEVREPEYILEGSDRRYIDESELYGMSEFECKLAMNELYARHGRMFDTPEIQAYFDTKEWYHGTITAKEWQDRKLENSYFNEYETANRDTIAAYQKKKGWRK